MEPKATGVSQRVRPRRLNSTRHEKIVEAALGEFLSCGYLGASLDEIARRAEVAKPTIYSYFGGKEELLYEAVRVGVFQTTFQVSRVLGAFDIRTSDLRGALIDVCRNMLVVLTSSPHLELRRLIMTEMARPHGLIRLPDGVRVGTGPATDQQARLRPTQRDAVNLAIQPGFEATAGLIERIMATRQRTGATATVQEQIAADPGQLARHLLGLTLNDMLQKSIVTTVAGEMVDRAVAVGVDAFLKISHLA